MDTADSPSDLQADAPPVRATPEQVAADPLLRQVAQSLADLYLTGHDLTSWLDGADHTPTARREVIADLVDAYHVLEHAEEWLDHLSGRDPRPLREPEPWLIDRPWRER